MNEEDATARESSGVRFINLSIYLFIYRISYSKVHISTRIS